MTSKRAAVLLDGGFVRRKLKARLQRHSTADDVVELVEHGIMDNPKLAGHELYRAFWYDAKPARGTAENPISGQQIDYGRSAIHHERFHSELELRERFAIRMGECRFQGWKIREEAIERYDQTGNTTGHSINADDLSPSIKQQGVDLKLGLDIAWMSVKRLVDLMVIVTGDADLVPAMKFARKEGIVVALESMGHGVYRDLKAHSDLVLG